MSKVLVLGAHPDDETFGCGGTIAKHIENGDEVGVHLFSSCRNVYGKETGKLLEELEQATRNLGLADSSVTVGEMPTRHFPEHRQEILDLMIHLRDSYDPDVVYCPSPDDKHQDHHVVQEEAVRAFPGRTLFGYRMPWNVMTGNGTAFTVLERRHLSAKLAAAAEYETQNGRPYHDGTFIEAWGRVSAVAAGLRDPGLFAEPFDVIQLIR